MEKNCMIAFVGYNTEQTIRNFKTFTIENKDNLTYSNNSMIIFKDGTYVFPIISATQALTRTFDYIIISDDRRMSAMYNEMVYQLRKRLSGYVPEEFSIIHDDIDDRLMKIF